MVTLRQMSDTKLIALYKKGNDSAIGELLHRHKQHLYTSLFFLVRDKKTADDLFQETWIRIILAIREGNYSDQGYFRAWAVRIAHNLFIDKVRVDRRMKLLRDTEEFSILNTLPSETESKDDQIIRTEEEEKVRSLIEKIPVRFREVLIMRHYGDMKFEEISRTLNINLNTALGRMRYALQYLKKEFEKDAIQNGEVRIYRKDAE
jgi:RNA polymerase sigma-70 factor (ECF subfamily)